MAKLEEDKTLLLVDLREFSPSDVAGAFAAVGGNVMSSKWPALVVTNAAPAVIAGLLLGRKHVVVAPPLRLGALQTAVESLVGQYTAAEVPAGAPAAVPSAAAAVASVTTTPPAKQAA